MRIARDASDSVAGVRATIRASLNAKMTPNALKGLRVTNAVNVRKKMIQKEEKAQKAGNPQVRKNTALKRAGNGSPMPAEITCVGCPIHVKPSNQAATAGPPRT